ncbi:MAG: hypothetical protein LBV67_08390 [Streptococcaceae bacterium]|jgi:hypothetical protein|nr:hypothetical protein [Streptococcaceae bacterium]
MKEKIFNIKALDFSTFFNGHKLADIEEFSFLAEPLQAKNRARKRKFSMSKRQSLAPFLTFQ